MRLVVIESPYAGEVERNVEYARACMVDSLRRGEAPIASHLLYTQEGVLNDNIADERCLGIYAGFMWGQKADVIVFYMDRGMSGGMINAEDYWLERGMPIEKRFLVKGDGR